MSTGSDGDFSQASYQRPECTSGTTSSIYSPAKYSYIEEWPESSGVPSLDLIHSPTAVTTGSQSTHSPMGWSMCGETADPVTLFAQQKVELLRRQRLSNDKGVTSDIGI